MPEVNRFICKSFGCQVDVWVVNLPTFSHLVELPSNLVLYLGILEVLVTLMNKTHGVCLLSNLFYLLIRGIRLAEKYVFFDGVVKKQRFLLNNANILTQTLYF